MEQTERLANDFIDRLEVAGLELGSDQFRFSLAPSPSWSRVAD